MKKNFSFLALYALLFLSISCRQATHEQAKIQYLQSKSTEQSAPWLTTDNEGNPVLCWTEKEPAGEFNRLMYSVYNIDSNLFMNPVIVPVSKGTKSSAENINKVAFKSDGTVLAFFGKRFENEKNPYAGAICYSMSSDKGLSWTPAQYIHSDTSHVYGRGYFDVSTLKNGEVGAVWLDGRFKNTGKGSSIFFASTQRNSGFTSDTCINKSTCECCRTDLLTDRDGNLHVAYRSIMYPENLMGKQTRDMVYSFSSDNGKSFSPEQVISKDNWVIDGCPHTGPSLAVNKDGGVNAAWFTAGGNPGLYYSSTPSPGTKFNGRNLVTAAGRHPQMISLADGRLAMVCEEVTEVQDQDHGAENQSHNGMSQNMPASGAKIILRVLNEGKVETTIPLTDGRYADHHAVAAAVKDGLLVAWVREENGHAAVCFSRVGPF